MATTTKVDLAGVCTEASSTDSMEPLMTPEDSPVIRRLENGIIERHGSGASLNRNESGASLNSLNLNVSSSPSISSKPFAGPRYRLIHEGEIQICRLNHTRTIVSKIMNSRYLRRWESHKIILGTIDIRSITVSRENLSCQILFWSCHTTSNAP